jgi:bifunctional ADP-heptose synthase (sugar kinase/adenylyltransferase)
VSGRFLVIGEGGIDRYIYGTVNRLAPDAPVPVINPTRETNNAGMAGNVAANLISLGATRVDTILSDPPITKTRYVDEASGYILVRVDENDRVKVPLKASEVIAKLDHDHYDACLISSYNKGYLTESTIEDIAAECYERSIPTFVDHKFILGHWSEAITYVKINEREYAAQVKALGKHPERFCENLIVTLGRDGAVWYPGGSIAGKMVETKVSVEPIAVSDLSGAGDTYLAAFTLMMTRTGGFVAESMDYANRAARVAVSKRGVVAVKQDEVQ